MHDFRKLEVWKSAMRLTVGVYEYTDKFPKEERFGLTSQIRRAAVSIPSNITEGAGRNKVGEFDYFIGIATGSSYELETQLMIACRVGYLENDDLNLLLEHLHSIQKQLYRFKQTLKK
jgi:four helix bundle protein